VDRAVLKMTEQDGDACESAFSPPPTGGLAAATETGAAGWMPADQRWRQQRCSDTAPTPPPPSSAMIDQLGPATGGPAADVHADTQRYQRATCNAGYSSASRRTHVYALTPSLSSLSCSVAQFRLFSKCSPSSVVYYE